MVKEDWSRMTAIEQLMLLENDPNNPMCFTGIIGLSINPTIEWLCANLLPRLLRHPRFASVVAKDPDGNLCFEKLEDFTSTSPTVASHFEIQTPIEPDKPMHVKYKEFITRVNSIASTSLPIDMPLWRVYIIPRFCLARPSNPVTLAIPIDEECCTLIFKVHHSISDGIGILKFFTAEMIDNCAPQNPSSLLIIPERQRVKNTESGTKAMKAKVRHGRNNDSQSKNISNQPLMTSTLAHRGVVTLMSDVLTDFYKTVVKPLFPDPDTVLTRGSITGQKRCALMAPGIFTVRQLREAGKRLGVTVNDLLYTAVSAGTSAYIQKHGDSGRKLGKIHCVIAINRTMMDTYRPTDVSNQLALLIAPLHVSNRDLLARLRCCVKTVRRLKRGVQAGLAIQVLRVVQWMPVTIRRPFWRYLSRSTSITYSNLPGPTQAVTVATVPVNYIQFFGPCDGHLGVTFSAFSYDNDIYLGLQTDENRVPDPDQYLDLIKNELDNLIQLSTKYGS